MVSFDVATALLTRLQLPRLYHVIHHVLDPLFIVLNCIIQRGVLHYYLVDPSIRRQEGRGGVGRAVAGLLRAAAGRLARDRTGAGGRRSGGRRKRGKLPHRAVWGRSRAPVQPSEQVLWIFALIPWLRCLIQIRRAVALSDCERSGDV